MCGDGKTEREVRRRAQAGANTWGAVEVSFIDRPLALERNAGCKWRAGPARDATQDSNVL